MLKWLRDTINRDELPPLTEDEADTAILLTQLLKAGRIRQTSAEWHQQRDQLRIHVHLQDEV